MIEHIGVAVKSIDESEKIFSTLLGSVPYKREFVASESVTTAFYKTGNTKIELLEAGSPESPVAKFIEKRGEGIHHIAIEVSDINKEMQRLRQEGFVFTYDKPRPGADNKMVVFIHPKSANGVLVELCQEIRG